MNGILQGRDWTVWEQIDEIVRLAQNRATTAYITAIDNNDVAGAQYWGNAARELNSVMRDTMAMVSSGAEVQPNVSQTDLYERIEAALEPFAMSGEMLDAIAELPFIASNPEHEIASRDEFGDVFRDIGVPPSVGKGVVGILVGAGLLYGLYRWSRGR